MPVNTENALNDAMQAISRQITGEIAEAEKRAKAAERKVTRLEKRLALEQSKRRDTVTSTRKDTRGLARKSVKLETRIEELTRELSSQQDEKLRLKYRSEALIDQVRRLSEDHHASTELFEHALQEVILLSLAFLTPELCKLFILHPVRCGWGRGARETSAG